MTHQHILLTRTEAEVTWFQRRSFISGAGAFLGAGGFAQAFAQQRSNIVELRGDVLLNGQTLRRDQFVQSGDTLQTGPGAGLVFVIGNSSFLVRQNSRLAVDRGASINAISVLRLLTGAVVSVWGKGLDRRIVTPTLTAGIRGTGVYTEVFPELANRSYLCNCYGAVDVAMNTNAERIASRSEYHQSFWGEPAVKEGRWLAPAKMVNHLDEELEALAKLVDQRTTWQAMGRKGVQDGKGFMDASQQPHPALLIPR
jgi:hypothetical protein